MFQRKKEKKAYDIFYNEYRMLDKLNYIKKVMSSCNTKVQLDVAFKWGKSTLWGWYDVMNQKYRCKYDFFDWLTIWRYIMHRTSELEKDITNKYNKLIENKSEN